MLEKATSRMRSLRKGTSGLWNTPFTASILAGVRWLTAIALWPWRYFSRRRFPIIRPYVNPRHPARVIARIAFPIGLALICIVYGFMFGLTAPYLIVPFTVPIVILVLLAIWALPETHNAPTRSMEAFHAAVVVSLLVWPNYLALSLPGLPWITALRLCSFPMAFLFLVSLSSSSTFRGELAGAMRATPGFWVMGGAFIAIQFLTVTFGQSPPDSLQTVLIAQVNWTAMCLISIWIARKPGKSELYAITLALLTLPMVAVAFMEYKIQHPLWLNNVPSFLKIDDELAAKYMRTILRGDLYRVKSIYASPLSFAESLAIISPICIHIAINKYSLILRLTCASLIPAYFLCIRMTDARLGILGLLVAFLAYLLLWAVIRLGKNSRSLMAAAVVYAYPAAFGLTVALVVFVHRFRVLLLGNGQAASSDDARQEQLRLGIPKIIDQPWGYGAANAAETLGFSPHGFLTIDNYYLSIALDYGVLGLITFYGIFIATITAAVRTILRYPAAFDSREKMLLLPFAVSMTVFVVIRAVLSQEDNHVLAFTMLGILVGLIYRVRQTGMEQQLAGDPESTALSAKRPNGIRGPKPGLTTTPPTGPSWR